MIKVNGYPTKEQVKTKFPKIEKLVKPIAIIECYQEIPCNPCSTSCPVNAITIGEDINKIPKIDYDLCIGCGSCVYSCPGLCIMLVSIKEDLAIFQIPYELLPVPLTGEIWSGIDRSGHQICEANILKTLKNKQSDRTVIVTVSVPKEFLYDFSTVGCKL
ncbi:MAG: 4Fe-4S binding protein [Tenericutes bacterium]|nr:4Fe-4S binding protein [Mycoplasmatota bacterium]